MELTVTNRSRAWPKELVWYNLCEVLKVEDRVFRIGQTNDVDIYYQIFKDTQYERMWNIVLKKELVINSVIKKEEEK